MMRSGISTNTDEMQLSPPPQQLILRVNLELASHGRINHPLITALLRPGCQSTAAPNTTATGASDDVSH